MKLVGPYYMRERLCLRCDAIDIGRCLSIGLC